MKQYRVGVVGIGAVGGEMVRLLRERDFPCSEILIMARSERDEEIGGETYRVVEAAPEAFEGIDFAFFAGTEGAKGASRTLGWEAVKRGAVVIDNGDDFRMDPRVPLVIPEINADALDAHAGFVANPNCSTIITLMALGALHKVNPIRRFVAATYQAVSGAGRQAVDELEAQMRGYARGESPRPEVFPHPILANAIPQIGGEKAEMPGYTSEEAKLRFESRKILNAPELRVSATCVRIPVFCGHAAAVNVEFSRPMTAAEARAVLSEAPGVCLADDLAAGRYPTPLMVAGTDAVAVGRIRPDDSVDNGLALFVAGDNLRKGAALNAIQIAEALIAR